MMHTQSASSEGDLFVDNFNEQTKQYTDKDPPTPIVPQKFSPLDPQALQHLEEYGYVVFKDVASADDIKTGVDLFWKHLKGKCNVDRDDISTWGDDKWPGDLSNGIIFDIGIGHSEFMWYSRSLPAVHKLFSHVWGDDDLLVSFDGCGVFRPIEANKMWRTSGGWYHVDQNGSLKKGRHAVQGLLNYFPAGEHDGGLVVVPRSHTMVENAFVQKKKICSPLAGDFIKIDKNTNFWVEEQAKADPNTNDLRPVKLCLLPGDFVMWDSRTIHCNHPPTKLFNDENATKQLKRLVAYVCMTPAKLAKDIKFVAKQRVQGFKSGTTTNHWPHEFHPVSTSKGETDELVEKLTLAQKQMIASRNYVSFFV